MWSGNTGIFNEPAANSHPAERLHGFFGDGAITASGGDDDDRARDFAGVRVAAESQC
jgi:hypothetical protein